MKREARAGLPRDSLNDAGVGRWGQTPRAATSPNVRKETFEAVISRGGERGKRVYVSLHPVTGPHSLRPEEPRGRHEQIADVTPCARAAPGGRRRVCSPWTVTLAPAHAGRSPGLPGGPHGAAAPSASPTSFRTPRSPEGPVPLCPGTQHPLSAVTCFLPAPQGAACCLLSKAGQAPARRPRCSVTARPRPLRGAGPLPGPSFLALSCLHARAPRSVLPACGHSAATVDQGQSPRDFHLLTP